MGEPLEVSAARLEAAEEMVRRMDGVPEERRAALEQLFHIRDILVQFQKNNAMPFDVEGEPAAEDDEDPAATRAAYLAQMAEGETMPTISTITMTSGVGTRVNLSLMYELARDRKLIGAENGKRVLNLRYGNQPMLGAWPAIRARRPKKAQPQKFFFNQATMDIQLPSNPERFISCKLFENGKVQLSGNKSIENAREVMEELKELLVQLQDGYDENGTIHLKMIPVVANAFRHILEDPYWTADRRWRFLLRVRIKRYGNQIQRFCVPTAFHHMRKLVYQPEKLSVQPVQVEMINSDFHSGQSVDLMKLSRLVHDEYTSIKYRYDRTLYSGVIIKYPCSCHCSHGCETMEAMRLCAKNAAKRHDRKACHIITIICFHEGVVIITGARSYRMVQEGYQFIRKLYIERKNDIAMELPSEPLPQIPLEQTDVII